jgi:5-methylcytosine-specific restriction protein B
MSIAEFLARPRSYSWHEEAERFFETLIVGRYGKRGLVGVTLRAPDFESDEDTPFAGVLHKDSPSSGEFGGMGLFVFPGDTTAAMVALGIGARGLAADEDILSRPGHARLARAFVSWLRTNPSLATAWAKSDPTRTDAAMPPDVSAKYSLHARSIKRYGEGLYLVFDTEGVPAPLLRDVFVALLDLYMRERGIEPLVSHREQEAALRNAYEGRVLQSATPGEVLRAVRERRFVILQGPPGTGKTRLARELIKSQFAGRGKVIQFHPAAGYEQFIGSLRPIERQGVFGFSPVPGHLWLAAREAAEDASKPYLLVIDEINRADLARTLGEAIHLFEANEPDRAVDLGFDFGPPWGRSLQLPPNLHVLGTMNSADRSIAILDLAIRRRFAFLDLWPDESTLKSSHAIAREAFAELRRVFMAQASDEQLKLLPGHAYFLAESAETAKRRLRSELAPLLQEYLKQGVLAGFAEDIEGYLQWLDARTAL